MNTVVQELIAAVASLQGCRFVGLTYTSKESGEVARHTVALGVNYTRAYRRDLAILRRKQARLSGIDAQACTELIASIENSLANGIGRNVNYTLAETYIDLIPGLKVHRETGELYIMGFSLHKVVLVPGTYKVVKSRPLTIARRKLEKSLRKSRIRTYSVAQLTRFAISGEVLTLE